MQKLISRIKEYYKKPGNEAGGNCHIVLDDGNMELDNIIFCIVECVAYDDQEGLDIMKALRAMKYHDRVKLWRQL